MRHALTLVNPPALMSPEELADRMIERRAVEAAISDPPDLIILDVNMPGMSGFDVLAIIKKDENLAHIPVLMLTALADIDNRVIGLGLGADDYLAKPFSPRELAARIDARLRT